MQEHHARRLHWDLRLEHDGVLWSWAVPKGIPMLNKPNHLAVRTEDHPLEYLTFHGDIPQGQYGAGSMTIWDSGTYEAEKLRDDEVIVTLHGERVDGKYALFQTKGNQWMIHRMSPPADPDAEPVPHDLRADARDRVGRRAAATSELGVRDEVGRHARDHRDRGRATIALTSRQGNDATARFPELRRARRGARPDSTRCSTARSSLLDDARAPELRAAAAAHAGGLGVGARAGSPTERPVVVHVLRRAVARRPLDARAPVHRSPGAARAARALGPDVADPADDDRRRRRGATPPPATSGWRASSPSGSTAPTSPGAARTRGAR